MSTRFDDKKLEIVTAAGKRFIKHGLYKTTMDEIARDVRIGKSTVYHYFASKEELFYYTVEKERERYSAAVKAVFEAPEAESAQKWADYLRIKASLPKDYRLLYNVIILCLSGQSNTIEDDLMLKFFGEEMKFLSTLVGSPEKEIEAMTAECAALFTITFPLLSGLHQVINEKTADFLHGRDCVTPAVLAVSKLFADSK